MLISALLFSGVVLEATVSENVEAAEATSCQYSIEAVHGPVSFFDDKNQPGGGKRGYLGFYLGFRVTNNSGSAADLGVSVSMPANSGGTRYAVQLSSQKTVGTGQSAITIGAQPSVESIGGVANGSSGTAYFFAEVNSSGNTRQTISATILLNDVAAPNCSVFQTGVNPTSRDALQANANKIFSASVSNATDVVGTGSKVVVTVTGNTGTIGSGPSGLKDLNLVPVVVPAQFDPSVWKLSKVSYRTLNGNCEFTDALYLNKNTTPSSTACSGVYAANYVFFARDDVSSSKVLNSSSARVQAFS